MQEVMNQMKREIQARYGNVIRHGVSSQLSRSIPAEIYTNEQLRNMPEELIKKSFPCGNPVLEANLKLGETVLDLACGTGLDCFLASSLVGERGWVYGLEFTKEMLEQAIGFRRRMKLKNVKFLHADMEQIPLARSSVDVVMSNCGINLACDKQQVIDGVTRVLKPQGRLVIADIVSQGSIPDAMKEDPDAWTWCMGGACSWGSWHDMLSESYFDVKAIKRRDYQVELDKDQILKFEAVTITATRGD